MNCLYIYEINPLSFALFANIFSHSEDCIFILFMVSFAVQKLLSLTRSLLFIFAFISITQKQIKKDIAVIYVKECSVFFSKNFIVSSLTSMSLTHFELIFMYGVKE